MVGQREIPVVWVNEHVEVTTSPAATMHETWREALAEPVERRRRNGARSSRSLLGLSPMTSDSRGGHASACVTSPNLPTV